MPKKETKKVTKKKRKKEPTSMPLLITFIVLTVIVIILFITTMILYNKRKEAAKEPTIPIVSKNIKTVMNIDISNMKKDDKKEYIFNISNYGSKLIAKEKILYTISVAENKYNLDVKLYKNDQEKDIDDSQNSLEKSKQQVDKYKLVITSKEDIAKNSKLKVNINS